MHQFMGVELNMQTWNLLEKKDKDEKDDKRMIYFAKASLYPSCASFKIYEQVTALSAKVDVIGTLPGIFATQ